MTSQPAGRPAETVREHVSRVFAALSQEFGTRLDAVTIERIASEEVAAFDEARIRDFVPLLAIRQARLRLWASVSAGPGGGAMTR
jgi:hypothetical protein